MKDRIKKVRKILDLTQQEFADQIGSKRNTVATYEMGRSTPSAAVISLICKTFNVNEDWLRNGREPMFIKPESFSLDDFLKQHGAEELETEIVKAYFELPKDTRQELLAHFKRRFVTTTSVEREELNEAIQTQTNEEYTAAESDSEFDPEIEAELKTIRNRLYREKGQREILQTLKSGGSATRSWSGNLRVDNA